MKKSPLRKVSKKLHRENREYLKYHNEYLKELAKEQGREGESPFCEVCNVFKAIEIHHRAGRAGKYLTDKKFFLATCYQHHRFITENPQWAIDNGFTILRGDPERMLRDAKYKSKKWWMA